MFETAASRSIACLALAAGTLVLASPAAAQPTSACLGRPLTSPCGLMGGTGIDAMESASPWSASLGGGALSVSAAAVPGCQGQGVEITYDLGAVPDAYVQIRREFDPVLDLSAFDHIRFQYRGSTRNTIEIGLVTEAGQNYFATVWNGASHIPWCAAATWDLADFRLKGQPLADLTHIRAIFVSVSHKGAGVGDVGGAGTFLVDDIAGLSLAPREVPPCLEPLDLGGQAVASGAAQWIGASQQPRGWLKSWHEESADFAWTYDQAVGLLVLAESDPARASALAARILAVQNVDGSWYEGYHYLDPNDLPIHLPKRLGPVAWMVIALMRHAELNGSAAAADAAGRAADWLATFQRPDGSVADVGEWNLDSWWAFHLTGRQPAADGLRDFLLTQAWDGVVGRFKSDDDNPIHSSRQVFLDMQTWGAAFLRAQGREADARRALSYARWTLAVRSSTGGHGDVCGFDGAGPFGVWNEGTLQYVAMRGENSQSYWGQMVKQQRRDAPACGALCGALPGTPLANTLYAYTVWLTPWHGIAPTAWLYFAATGGPFPLAPAMVADDRAVMEGQAGTATASFSVRLSAPSRGVVAVGYATAPDTATAGIDYTHTAGTLTFPAGTVQQSIPVTVHGDTTPEPLESFFLDLAAPTNATLARGRAVGAIVDEEPARFHAIAPCRLADTRTPISPTGGPSLAANTRRVFPAAGLCGVPADARALALNVTVAQATDLGNLRLYPAGAVPPLTSTVNFAAGRARANNSVLPLGAGGGIEVQCDMPAGSAGSTQAILDVYGYFR